MRNMADIEDGQMSFEKVNVGAEIEVIPYAA